MSDNNNEMVGTVSVLCCFYNAEEHIVETIQSIIEQTYADLELILINDGSTDSSSRLILDSFSDSRIRLINRSNVGVAISRNFGLKLATGNFVALIDGDDLWHPQHIELAVRALINCPQYNWYAGNYVYQIEKPNFLNSNINSSKLIFESLNYLQGNTKGISSSSLVFRKEVLQHLWFPEGIWNGEDGVAWIKFSINYPSYIVSNVETVWYRKHERSVSNINNRTSAFLDEPFSNLPMPNYPIVSGTLISFLLSRYRTCGWNDFFNKYTTYLKYFNLSYKFSISLRLMYYIGFKGGIYI